jgi:hypothetical protein
MNIFDLLKSKWDMADELQRLFRLFNEDKIVEYNTLNYYTINDFVDYYCFEHWKNRHRYIDVNDYFTALGFYDLAEIAKTEVESFLTVIEVMYNFLYLTLSIAPNNNEIDLFRYNLDCCLNHYGYQIYYSKDDEIAIVAEIDPAATATAEISRPTTAYQIMQYNHHTAKGNITEKKRILLHLAAELEPRRKVMNSIDKTLTDDIFSLLNNLNLRHNNLSPGTKDYIQYVADMPNETLENWYDELYQMILLAKLELDHNERTKKVQELKSHF